MPRRPIIALVILAAVVLTGCARVVWVRSGLTAAEWNQDSYQCEKDARQSGYFGTGWVAQIEMERFMERCLLSKGYSKQIVQ